jgi:hypothetical protein
LQGNGGYREAITDYDLKIVSRGAMLGHLGAGRVIQVTAQVWARKIFIFGGGLGADFKQIPLAHEVVTEVCEEI